MTPLRSAAWYVHASSFSNQSTWNATASLSADQGQINLSFLSPTMARVCWQPTSGWREPRTWAIAPIAAGQATNDVPVQGRDRSDLSGFTTPALTHSADALETSRLRVRLHAGEGKALRLEWTCPQTGKVWMSERGTSAWLHEQRTGLLRHCVQRDPREHYFGLGDKTGALNLHGRRLRCMGLDSIGYDAQSGDPLYKHWPFLITRTADSLWTGIYYDTLAATTFDLGCEHDNYHGLYRSTEIDDGDLDYYFMVGNTPAEVISQFVQLIGGTHLPPRWTLGYAQTAMGLADAPDAQEQLSQFIDRCQKHRIPISSFHYGSGYSTRGKQRYVFTWNHSKFPDPEKVNAKFHAAGMQLVANLKPCLLDDHPAYTYLSEQKAFVAHSTNEQPVVEPFWDGQGAHLDFTKPQAVQWWQSKLKSQILEKGIHVGWNDNNEYGMAAEDAYSEAGGLRLPIHRSRPLHALLMTRATFEAQVAACKESPSISAPFTVTRAGPPGIQRYAQTWSGDNTTSWHTLKWNIRTGLQMSLSGMFNIGHDVGGFYGPIPDAELFLRWVQSCSLNPRMVMNSWKAGNVSNVPWMHAEVTDAVRDAIALRYRLMPYMWQCFERASLDHVPIIRPTFYNFPNDVQCLEDCDEFMLGEALLFAPVVEQDAKQRRLYLPALPEGEQWFDFYTGQAVGAAKWHEQSVNLRSMPLLVRQGQRVDLADVPAGQLPRFNDSITGSLLFRSAL
jgi:alpha-glucosidase